MKYQFRNLTDAELKALYYSLGLSPFATSMSLSGGQFPGQHVFFRINGEILSGQ